MKRTVITASLALALLAGTGSAFAQGPDHRGPGDHHGPRFDHKRGPGPAGRLFKEADTNRDGKVTRAEFLAESNKKANFLFDRLDKNRDGVISKKELKEARKDHRHPPRHR